MRIRHSHKIFTVIDCQYLCCYCNWVIFFSFVETPGLSSKSPIEALQGSYMSALKSHMEFKYPDQAGRFAKLLLRLPALRDVCSKGFEYFLLVRAKLEGEVPMSTLLQEMFESPRIWGYLLFFCFWLNCSLWYPFSSLWHIMLQVLITVWYRTHRDCRHCITCIHTSTAVVTTYCCTV